MKFGFNEESKSLEEITEQKLEPFIEVPISELIDEALDKKDQKQFQKLTKLLKRNCESVIRTVEEN